MVIGGTKTRTKDTAKLGEVVHGVMVRWKEGHVCDLLNKKLII